MYIQYRQAETRFGHLYLTGALTLPLSATLSVTLSLSVTLNPNTNRDTPWMKTSCALAQSNALAPSSTIEYENELATRSTVVGLMSLTALQFGLQPLLFKTFVRKEVSGASIVVATDVTKVLICLSIMWARGSWGRTWRGWMLEDSLKCAAVGIEYVCESYWGQWFIYIFVPSFSSLSLLIIGCRFSRCDCWAILLKLCVMEFYSPSMFVLHL